MLEFKKKSFLNEGTKHQINYIEGLNTKNKNIKGVESPQIDLLKELNDSKK